MDNSWKKQLRREASEHGMCAENRNALSLVETKAEAIALYKRTIDWALEEGYPSIGVLKSEFSDCEENGIYVGKHFNGETLKEQEVYVFHGCKGTIRTGLNVAEKIIPMMYFANGCEMTILPAEPFDLSIRVPIYIFGNNIVKNPEGMQFFTHSHSVKNG